MGKFLNFLTIDDDKVSKRHLLILILIAYIFSVGVRYIWVAEFSNTDSFKWNEQLMINTNDGYFWAEGARDILNGEHQPNDLSPTDEPTSILTAFFAKIFPISFESLILYLPAYLGSLLVIPVILIARSIGKTYMGFVASLLAGIVWSYYNRTMVGYYDTDMLNIVLPTFMLWGVIFGVTHNKNRWLLIVTFIMLSYLWWYAGSYSLSLAMTFMLFIYTLAFDRRNSFNYKLISMMLIVLIPIISIFAKLIISLALFGLYHYMDSRDSKFQKIYDFLEQKRVDNFKLIIYILIFLTALVLLSGGFNPILGQLKSYVFREAVASDISLKFFNVVQTVREAGAIPFETFANRISGHTITFILSSLGYILLSLRYRVMLLALPMVGLGFLALNSGLRFTVYAVPINALGIAYLIFLVAKYIRELFNQKIKLYSYYGAIAISTVLILYPNIVHIQEYKVPVVFNKDEVKVLDKLKTLANREDYALTWWDYGYPIRYYSDVKTLADGGKHSGAVNYPVSFSLTHPDEVAAMNMARLNTEFTELIFKDKNLSGSVIQNIFKEYGFKNSQEMIGSISSKDFNLPNSTRDIYLYYPLRMLNIFPTVRLFSNLDIDTGREFARPFFYYAQSFQDAGSEIHLGSGIKIFKQGGAIQIGNQKIPMREFIVVGYNREGNLARNVQKISSDSPISVIFMQSYNSFLVLDQNMRNSSYIKHFVLEEFDAELVEPVILTPLVKVFKLKV